MGWWANPLNPPTRGGLSRVTKNLAHLEVSRVGLTSFLTRPVVSQPVWAGLAHFDMSTSLTDSNREEQSSEPSVLPTTSMLTLEFHYHQAPT